MRTSPLLFQHAPHEAGESILDVTGLSARYNGHNALEKISFRLNPGERVAVVGPNGAGKSTLFKIIAGVMDASEGEVKIFGHGPSGHICIAYVPQRSQVDWQFPATVEDVVMMGRVGKIGVLRWPRKKDWELVRDSLKLVGMDLLGQRQIGELSGGQQQRVFLAQALAQEAGLILLDEPLTGLDTPSQETIMQILDELKSRKINIMIATHDLQAAAANFDRVLLLNGRLISFATPEVALTPENLLAAYGGHLHLIPTRAGEMMMIEDACHDCD